MVSLQKQCPLLFTAAAVVALLVLSYCLSEWSCAALTRQLLVQFRSDLLLCDVPALVAVATLVVLVYPPFFRREVQRLPARWLFILFTCLAMFLLRWPAFAAHELNPDESTQLCGALNLLRDPRYWRSFDGFTHGPMLEYPLLTVRLFSMTLDYGAARFIGLGFLIGTVLCMFGILRTVFAEHVSRAAITPVGICIAQITHPDLIAYNAEHPAVFVLALAGYLCARVCHVPRARLAFVAGCTLGLIPFTKLQAAPIAFAITAVTFWRLGALAIRHERRPLFAFTLGGLTPAVVVLLYVCADGALEYFWMSQVLMNVAYAERHARDGTEAYRTAFWILFRGPSLKLPYAMLMVSAGPLLLLAAQLGRRSPFWWLLALPALAMGLFWFGIYDVPQRLIVPAICLLGMGVLASCFLPIDASRRRVLLTSYLCVAAAIIAVAYPMNLFLHYLLLLAVPFVLSAAIVLALILDSLPAGTLMTRLLALALGLFVLAEATIGREFVYVPPPGPHPNVLDVTAIIERHADPGDGLCVWGFMDQYYVLTGMGSATRFPHNYRQLHKALQAYFRQVYIEDFDRHPPAVFVDAVSDSTFIFKHRLLYGYETFPALRQRIDANYHLVSEVEGVRIFVRNERLSARTRRLD